MHKKGPEYIYPKYKKSLSNILFFSQNLCIKPSTVYPTPFSGPRESLKRFSTFPWIPTLKYLTPYLPYLSLSSLKVSTEFSHFAYHSLLSILAKVQCHQKTKSNTRFKWCLSNEKEDALNIFLELIRLLWEILKEFDIQDNS